jgi:hypothetical protein
MMAMVDQAKVKGHPKKAPVIRRMARKAGVHMVLRKKRLIKANHILLAILLVRRSILHPPSTMRTTTQLLLIIPFPLVPVTAAPMVLTKATVVVEATAATPPLIQTDITVRVKSQLTLVPRSTHILLAEMALKVVVREVVVPTDKNHSKKNKKKKTPSEVPQYHKIYFDVSIHQYELASIVWL